VYLHINGEPNTEDLWEDQLLFMKLRQDNFATLQLIKIVVKA
jgi:hypothetical protein